MKFTIRTAEELQRHAADQAAQRDATATLALKDEPPPVPPGQQPRV